MAWYRCFIRGENFPGELLGRKAPVGFYVTHTVEASDENEAERLAVDLLRREPILTLPEGVAKPLHARIDFEEIVEISEREVPAQLPGFTWYPMDA